MTRVSTSQSMTMCRNKSIVAVVRTVEQYFITVLIVTILSVSSQLAKPGFTSRDITVTSSRSSNDVTKSPRTSWNQPSSDEFSVKLTTTTVQTLLTALDSAGNNQRRKTNTSRTWSKAAVTGVTIGPEVVTGRPMHSNTSQQQQQQHQHHPRQHHSSKQQQQQSEMQSPAAGSRQQQQQQDWYDVDDKSTGEHAPDDDYSDNDDYNYNTQDGGQYSNEEMLNYDYSHQAFNYSIDSEDLFSRLMPSNGRSRPEPINMSLLVIYSWLGLVVIMVIITVIILKFKPQLNSGCQRASDFMLCRKRRVPGVEEGNTLLTHPLV